VCIEGSERSITEFFIMRKYRRQGVGKWVATAVFNKLPAKWEVRVVTKNIPAQKFWRQTIAEYTSNQFEETELDNDDWQGPVFCFDNGS
jgi:predicted acetyltransferase